MKLIIIKYICIFDFSVFIIENYFMVRKTIKTIKKRIRKEKKIKLKGCKPRGISGPRGDFF